MWGALCLGHDEAVAQTMFGAKPAANLRRGHSLATGQFDDIRLSRQRNPAQTVIIRGKSIGQAAQDKLFAAIGEAPAFHAGAA